MKPNLRLSVLLSACLAAAPALAAVTLTIDAGHPGAAINPAMWGIFFEDINFGADGGLYAEMVKNRSFEFPDPMMGWIPINPNTASGELSVRTEDPASTVNPHYLRLRSAKSVPFGVSNLGFRGMGLSQDESYNFSAQVRAVSGSPVLQIQLVAGDGTVLDSVKLDGFGQRWNEATATLHPKTNDWNARLNVLLISEGAVDLDMVSLFPAHTWKGRPKGLRADMVQTLANLHPGFLRFPGGCIVEGSHLDLRYQWKKTIGPVADRPFLINRWNREFAHRPTPDYFQSFGLGFFEFFQLCEDIGAQPLPILNCGMACQFNSGELCPIDQLEPYIQDALDLIEFANGPADSPWGAKRAAMGHPEPFHLRMMGVGNEQWGPQYIERYTNFAARLKAAHPEIMLVSDAGPSPNDERFQYLWPKLCALGADIVDQHCYDNPAWFFENTHRYDNYDRNGPKIFMGEYAAQSVAIVSPKNRNTLECALAEAAYMTGLERNADVVRMASYAPLFANADAWQWTPDLIWVDNHRVCPTVNYYVQQMFSRNHGDVILPFTAEGAGTNLFFSSVQDNQSGRILLKVVNAAAESAQVSIRLQAASQGRRILRATTLAGRNADEDNTLDQPGNIVPIAGPAKRVKSKFSYTFLPLSLTILDIGLDRHPQPTSPRESTISAANLEEPAH